MCSSPPRQSPSASNLRPSETKIISLSRKVLEQRKKEEEEEERWKEKQRQREKKLQRVVLKRAQANDPHLTLAQTSQSKLKEFKKQDLQRRKEYQREIKDMQERVKGRPLLLEQVAQRNAKQAAEKHYLKTLHGCDVTEDFISSNAAKAASLHTSSLSSEHKQNAPEEEDVDYEPVRYRKVFLDDEDIDDTDEIDGRRVEQESGSASSNHQDGEDISAHHMQEDQDSKEDHYSDESYHYSDDQEDYSDDSDNDDDSKQQEQEQ